MAEKATAPLKKTKARVPRPLPERTCVACRVSRPKRHLVRLVRTAEGTVEVDKTGKRAGRGAYLCPAQVCWPGSGSEEPGSSPGGAGRRRGMGGVGCVRGTITSSATREHRGRRYSWRDRDQIAPVGADRDDQGDEDRADGPPDAGAVGGRVQSPRRWRQGSRRQSRRR